MNLLARALSPPRLLLALLLASPLAPLRGATTLGDGWDFLAKGKPAFARTAFQNQLKKNPKDTKLRTGLGLAELALGNATGACEQLLETIHDDPGDPQARLGLARAFLLRARSRIALGRGGEEETKYFLLDAENQADRAGQLTPADPDPWVVIAEARLERGEFESAERAVGEAEKRGLDVVLLRRLRGELSFFLVASRAEEGGESDYDEAKRSLVGLIASDPGAAELKLRLGDLHHAFGHWTDALDAWQKALAIEPFDRPTLELVLAYLKVPDLRARATQVLETAMKSAQTIATGGDPRAAYALFCVGQARLADHDLDAAATLFKKARHLDPTLEVPCSLGLADAAYKSQHHEEAAAAWKAAFAANREEAKALLDHLGQAGSVSASFTFLGDQAMKKGQQGTARDYFELASALSPNDDALLNNYAFLCRETGQQQKSWEAYSRLVELAPNQPRYLNDTALILHDYLKKDLPLARSLYERAIAAADALLADPATPEVTRAMALSAKTDATSNLARLNAKGRG